MQAHPMRSVRFEGDRIALESMRSDEVLAGKFDHFKVEQLNAGARKALLAEAVRVDGRILPELDRVIDELRDRAGLVLEVEVFVHQHPMIQASVLRSGARLIVLLSSAAIEKLTAPELEFVIGHELGHVVFEHVSVPVGPLLSLDASLSARHRVQLLSWSRKAEISADRAGLLCCGSLEVAAGAFFKVLSGLSLPGLRVNAVEFARQFDHLRDAIWEQGSEEMWQMTHPLSPLRMKSLVLFWNARDAGATIPSAPAECDREVAGLLAFMDPMSARGEGEVDPVLLPFVIWGGMYVASANGTIDASERTHLRSLMGAEHLSQAMAAPRSQPHYREQFAQARARRTSPLRALDINRILTCLIAVALADGAIDDGETRALHAIGADLGVAPPYVDGLIAQSGAATPDHASNPNAEGAARV